MVVRIFVFSLLALLVSGCGDEEADPTQSENNLAMPEICACPDGVCAPGECVLVVELEDSCAEVTEADIYINDFGEDAAPVARVKSGHSYTTCDPFRAPSEGDAGEVFKFLVKTPDGRRISNTLDDAHTCAASAPFTFKVDLCF